MTWEATAFKLEEDKFKNATYLFFNRTFEEHNINRLVGLNNPIVLLIVKNYTINGWDGESEDFCGLENQLYLSQVNFFLEKK